MKSVFLLAAATLVAAGCADQPALFPGTPEPAPRVVLPAGDLAVYEQDTVTLDVRGDGAARAQLLVLDSAGAVLWRSEEAPVRGAAAAVPVSGVGIGVPRGAVLRVTGALVTRDGERYYASDDTAAVRTLSAAATRAMRIFAGRRVRAWSGSNAPADLVAAPELGLAFYANTPQGLIGTLELSGNGGLREPVAAGAAPAKLAYSRGVLAALSADGGEVSFLRAGPEGLSPERRTLLPALEIEADTSFLAAARPAGRTLALACAPGCDAPVAVIPSALVVLKGTAGAAPGVVRIVPADSTAPSRLVLPGHESAVRGDSAVALAVFTPMAPDGSRRLLQSRAGASRCLSASLPDVVALAPDGRLYAGSAATPPPCGPGTRIVRLDSALSGAPAVSALAVRNTLAEARLGAVGDLQLSDDGTRLLVRGDSAVLVTDADLRVLGTLPVTGATAVAWLRGAGAPARIAVADSTGVAVYDAARLTRLVHIPVGRTARPLVFVHRAEEDVLAAPIAGGFVVARVPAP